MTSPETGFKVVTAQEVYDVLSDRQTAGLNQAIQIAPRFQRDLDWLARNEQELKRQFPNKWIAIKSFTVLTAKDTQDELLEALRGMGENPGFVLRWQLKLPQVYLSPIRVRVLPL